MKKDRGLDRNEVLMEQLSNITDLVMDWLSTQVQLSLWIVFRCNLTHSHFFTADAERCVECVSECGDGDLIHKLQYESVCQHVKPLFIHSTLECCCAPYSHRIAAVWTPCMHHMHVTPSWPFSTRYTSHSSSFFSSHFCRFQWLAFEKVNTHTGLHNVLVVLSVCGSSRWLWQVVVLFERKPELFTSKCVDDSDVQLNQKDYSIQARNPHHTTFTSCFACVSNTTLESTLTPGMRGWKAHRRLTGERGREKDRYVESEFEREIEKEREKEKTAWWGDNERENERRI